MYYRFLFFFLKWERCTFQVTALVINEASTGAQVLQKRKSLPNFTIKANSLTSGQLSSHSRSSHHLHSQLLLLALFIPCHLPLLSHILALLCVFQMHWAPSVLCLCFHRSPAWIPCWLSAQSSYPQKYLPWLSIYINTCLAQLSSPSITRSCFIHSTYHFFKLS